MSTKFNEERKIRQKNILKEIASRTSFKPKRQADQSAGGNESPGHELFTQFSKRNIIPNDSRNSERIFSLIGES